MAEEVNIVCIFNWKHINHYFNINGRGVRLTVRLSIDQGPVVLKVNNAIGFPNTYPLDNDLAGGKRYPPFEQSGSDFKYSQAQI